METVMTRKACSNVLQALEDHRCQPGKAICHSRRRENKNKNKKTYDINRLKEFMSLWDLCPIENIESNTSDREEKV